MHRYIRFALAAGIVGGLLLAAGSVVALATGGGNPMSARAVTTAFAVAAALELLGTMALLIGVGGIVAAAAPRGGRFLFVAYAAAVGALSLNMGWMWADLFLSDTVARVAPGVLDGTDDAVVGRLGIGMLVAWLANIGFLLLAVAVGRSHALPRATWVALTVAGVVTLVPLPIDGAGYNVVIGLALATSAATALRSPSVAATSETSALHAATT
jgi:hypothetical protein